MNKYECLYILAPDLAEDVREGLINKFSDMVTKAGGTVDGIDRWGNKHLAYAINFKHEGYYVLMNVTANATTPKEIESLMHITDGVMRCMFVRKDK